MAAFQDGVRCDRLQEPLLNADELRSKEATEATRSVGAFGATGLLSLATIAWLDPLLALGFRKPLNIEDVPVLVAEDRGRAVYAAFHSNWQRRTSEHPERAPSIAAALVRTFWVLVLVTGVLVGLTSVASYVGPFLIDDFVEFLGGRRRFRMEGYALVGCFFVADVVRSLAERHYNLGIYRLSVRVRACLTATLFEKVGLHQRFLSITFCMEPFSTPTMS